MTEYDHDCAGKIYGDYRDVSGRVYSCSRKGTVERDGKWYCWQHDPERVEADKERRWTEWEAAQKRKAAQHRRRAAMYRICKGVSTEDLEKLEADAIRHLLNSQQRSEFPQIGHDARS